MARSADGCERPRRCAELGPRTSRNAQQPYPSSPSVQQGQRQDHLFDVAQERARLWGAVLTELLSLILCWDHLQDLLEIIRAEHGGLPSKLSENPRQLLRGHWEALQDYGDVPRPVVTEDLRANAAQLNLVQQASRPSRQPCALLLLTFEHPRQGVDIQPWSSHAPAFFLRFAEDGPFRVGDVQGLPVELPVEGRLGVGVAVGDSSRNPAAALGLRLGRRGLRRPLRRLRRWRRALALGRRRPRPLRGRRRWAWWTALPSVCRRHRVPRDERHRTHRDHLAGVNHRHQLLSSCWGCPGTSERSKRGLQHKWTVLPLCRTGHSLPHLRGWGRDPRLGLLRKLCHPCRLCHG
mmetsp:Transcript_41250/g.114666  ORF Transcript_41250/g.114666 Transcript_41250/m.114666 type:complete len:350 (-) Transcript_41250:500-1549(-)